MASDAIGWLAAIGGMFAFGSFGVPIKSDAARSVNVDPLVFQSYKTAMCFLTSWLILLTGEEFSFTPWGIISGLFWVPGGVATIYAVKTAGLAIGIGVGSSFIVLVSFTWGIFWFDEHVHSRISACIAVGCMIGGLFGMAYFSSPKAMASGSTVPGVEHNEGSDYQGLNSVDTAENDEEDQSPLDASPNRPGYTDLPVTETTFDNIASEEAEHAVESDDDIASSVEIIDETELDGIFRDAPEADMPKYVLVCGRKIPERTLGILAAAFCGIWGGSIMVPMQWCPSEEKGSHYLISFAIGASIINIALWIFRYCFLAIRHASPTKAYKLLPSFHIRKMWLAGGTAGTLWSIGNFCSIISVEYLGEGVGYSVVQASMLVSGLWGIFYFHEVTGKVTIAKWFASATLTVFGILLLSYEHEEK